MDTHTDSLGWEIDLHEDIGYVFRLNPRQSSFRTERHIYWVDVEVYEPLSWTGYDYKTEKKLGIRLMPRDYRGDSDEREMVRLEDLNDDNGEWLARGYIKSDGCSNMEFNDCVHLCGMRDAKNFSQMIVRLWEKVQALCQASDEDFG